MLKPADLNGKKLDVEKYRFLYPVFGVIIEQKYYELSKNRSGEKFDRVEKQ